MKEHYLSKMDVTKIRGRIRDNWSNRYKKWAYSINTKNIIPMYMRSRIVQINLNLVLRAIKH